jgi:hypothetical protein
MKRLPPKKLQSGLSRRQILSMLGWAGAAYPFADPLDMITNGIVDSLIREAQAQGAIQPRNYVCVLFGGAPTQWVWNFLRPRGDLDPFIGNFSMKNRLTENYYSGDNSKTEYVVMPITLPNGQVIHLPPLWASQLPTRNGGSIPMSEITQNMIMFRGVNMQVDIGHQIGPSRVPGPIPSEPTLSGLVAEASNTPIPAIGTSGFSYQTPFADPKLYAYKSGKGVGIILLRGTGDGINKILSPFSNTDPVVTAQHLQKLQSQIIEQKIQVAMQELGDYSRSGKPGSEVLYTMRSKAEELFKRTFGNLSTIYTDLELKYKTIANRCGTESIANIIPPSGAGSYNATLGGDTGIAGQFALAEFLLKEGLSSTVTISGSNVGVNGIGNLNDEHGQAAGPHGHDRQNSLICHSFQFRCVAAMIQELKTALGPTIWENTVVEVGAEYDRSPRDTVSTSSPYYGSDHAPESNTLTIFSGAIQQPLFRGNIKVNGRESSTYKGTWGAAAPVNTNFGNNIIVTNEHVASSVAKLLRIESPARAPSLIEVDANGSITSQTEDPRNVG